jgi:hypothetical protein
LGYKGATARWFKELEALGGRLRECREKLPPILGYRDLGMKTVRHSPKTTFCTCMLKGGLRQ